MNLNRGMVDQTVPTPSIDDPVRKNNIYFPKCPYLEIKVVRIYSRLESGQKGRARPESTPLHTIQRLA